MTEQLMTEKVRINAERLEHPSDVRTHTIPAAAQRGGRENLARIGATPEPGKILDAHADPSCGRCKGTGEVAQPDRSRGGHVCPCTLP
mgnify:CR=1 FL=1